ncbi:acid phosphatase type 7-like isoform X4 [Argonauta hians]
MDNSTTIANTSTVNTTSTTSTANAGATTTTETTTTNTTNNNNNNNNNNSKNNPGNWTAFRMNGTAVNTYGKFTVHNTTHMFWELLEKDNIVDSVWIVKDVHSKNNVSEKLKKKILKDIMDQLLTTTLKPAKTTASVPPVAGGGGGGGVDAKGGSRGGGGGGRGRAGKPSRGGGGGVNTHSSDGSVETLPFLTDNRRQTLIIVLSGVGGSMLILITIYVAVKSHRNRLKPLGAWNESKKSFYRNIQNLENDLGPEDDFSGNSSPTSKLLSDSMDM